MSLQVVIPIAAGGDDIWIQTAYSATYPPASTSNTITSTDANIWAVRENDSGVPATPYRNAVSLAKFNTAANIPAGSTVLSALLRGYVEFAFSGDTLNLIADWYTWTGVTGDYTNSPGNTAIAGTNISTSLTQGASYDISLSNAPANISLVGYSYLRLGISQRTADAAPTTRNYLGFASLEHTTQPELKLVVTCTVPPSGTLSNQYAVAQGGTTPTGYAGQLTSPDNAVGSGETTQATSTGATQSSNYGSFYSFGTAFSDGLPSNATVTAVTLEARQWISTTTRGTVGMSLQSAPNTLIGTELSGALSITAAPTAGTAGTGNSYTAWTTLPTAAQLASSNFRVQPRYQRTAAQAATYTLDWLRLSVTYTSPGIPGSVTVTAKGG